jgi:hypothetical protein
MVVPSDEAKSLATGEASRMARQLPLSQYSGELLTDASAGKYVEIILGDLRLINLIDTI